MTEVFSDDEYPVNDSVFSSPETRNRNRNTNGSPSNSASENSPSPVTTVRDKIKAAKAGLLKIPAVQRLQESTRVTRSRSRSPTPSNGNGGFCPGTPTSPLVNENGTIHNGVNTNHFEQSTSNGDASTPTCSRRSRIFRHLVPAYENPNFTFMSQQRRNSNGGVTLFQIFIITGIAIGLGFVYSFVDIKTSIANVRSEFHETMNHYQMHLLNLQNYQNNEAKEGKERDQRIKQEFEMLHGSILEIKKMIRPNYIEGIKIHPPSAAATPRHPPANRPSPPSIDTKPMEVKSGVSN